MSAQPVVGPPHIARPAEGADPAVIAELGRIGVATVHEAYERRGLARGLTPLSMDQVAAGTAVTALCHAGDNLMINAAIDTCRPGDMLVVATLSPSEHGMFGDLLMTLCQAKGIAGLVIDAGVRDTRDIRAAGFPVWSRVVSAQGATKQAAGWVNVPVVIGGTPVEPGDVVCGDADGVVVVPRDDALRVRDAALHRLASEERSRARYATGVGKDVSELLRAAGVTIDPPGERP